MLRRWGQFVRDNGVMFCTLGTFLFYPLRFYNKRTSSESFDCVNLKCTFLWRHNMLFNLLTGSSELSISNLVVPVIWLCSVVRVKIFAYCT